MITCGPCTDTSRSARARNCWPTACATLEVELLPQDKPLVRHLAEGPLDVVEVVEKADLPPVLIPIAEVELGVGVGRRLPAKPRLHGEHRHGLRAADAERADQRLAVRPPR